jgi:hypothetical protein
LFFDGGAVFVLNVVRRNSFRGSDDNAFEWVRMIGIKEDHIKA